MAVSVYETIDRMIPQQDANNFPIEVRLELAVLRTIWNMRVAERYISTHFAPCGGPPPHSPYLRRQFRVWTRLL
jgi:hypothetical protein